VALATTHLPLSAVPGAITTDLLNAKLEQLINGLTLQMGMASPRITVLGLNPHAGENGHLGREETEVISPVCEAFRAAGHHILGPISADTAFLPETRAMTDAYLAMYHDQGLPVLKTLGFHHAVNITLGLPIVRTSVDHGTALALAGTGNANPESLVAAIEAAIALRASTHTA
jgi:4-hydroxythreonine-4-phosphate dehydrogenase